MRHNKKINHLGRTSSHREAMLSNMASSLIKHKRIFTTTAKAKSLRKYVEPLITKSKEDTTHSRRIAFSYLQDKAAITELFTVISEKIGDRPGGYTRIIRTGNRLGDNATMCFIELVDFNENMLKDTKKASAKTRRSRKKATDATIATAPKKDTKPVEDVKAAAKKVEATVEKVEEVVETAAENIETIAEDVVEKVEEAVVEAATEVVEAAEEVVADVANEAVEVAAEVVADVETAATEIEAVVETVVEETKIVE